MENRAANTRIWELDFFRGIALILMVFFHIIFDMKDIYEYNVDYTTPIIYYEGKVAAILFMLISGISCYLSRSNVKRGIKVLIAAMFLTLVTHLFNKELGIKFGILHFLGTSMLLFPVFKSINKYILIIIGTVIIIIGNMFTKINMTNDFLFMFNLTSSTFTSSDYYPLLPWFGIFLYGVSLGKIFYFNKKSAFNFTIRENMISRAGRNTFIVYLIHQPIIIAVLELIKRVNV